MHLRRLAEEAGIILKRMAKIGYDEISNSCQTFCNLFLKRIDDPQYMTTAGLYYIH